MTVTGLAPADWHALNAAALTQQMGGHGITWAHPQGLGGSPSYAMQMGHGAGGFQYDPSSFDPNSYAPGVAPSFDPNSFDPNSLGQGMGQGMGYRMEEDSPSMAHMFVFVVNLAPKGVFLQIRLFCKPNTKEPFLSKWFFRSFLKLVAF